MSSLAGCLITHEHGDHAKAINDIMKAGVNVYATRGTALAADATTYRLHLLESKGEDSLGNPNYSTVRIGTLAVKPFLVKHDAAEPVGYFITSTSTGERLLFMTDSYYTEYKFPSLTHIMIEANYSAESLADDPRRHRLRRSHMSIENCIELLKANDLSRCAEIWLLHLSSSNGDAEGFKRKVQEATGCPTYIA